MKQYLAAAAILTFAGSAMAQTTPSTAPAHPAPQAATAGHNGALRQQMVTSLQQAGFTDVKVMPESYLVRAKDKSGSPVSMFITPDSVTEVVAGNAPGSTSSNTTGANQSSGEFTTVPTGERMSSTVVGLDVHNSSNQDIGSIKDLALENGTVKAYILGVGGFLGMGDHYVAVSPSALNITWNHSSNKWQATMNTTADQLKAAPEFKYPAKS